MPPSYVALAGVNGKANIFPRRRMVEADAYTLKGTLLARYDNAWGVAERQLSRALEIESELLGGALLVGAQRVGSSGTMAGSPDSSSTPRCWKWRVVNDLQFHKCCSDTFSPT